MLFGFLADKSEEDCRAIIEDYAEGGQDQGLTRALMRQACGLPVHNEGAGGLPEHIPSGGIAQASSVAPPSISGMPPSSQEVRAREELTVSERLALDRKRELQKEHLALVEHVLSSGSDYISKDAVSRHTRSMWKSRSADTRQKIFEEMLQLGMWQDLGKRGQQASACIPVIETRRSLESIVDLSLADESEHFGELFDADKFRSLLDAPGRDSNFQTLRGYYTAVVQENRRKGRGRESQDVLERRQDAEKQLAKLDSIGNALESLRTTFGTVDAPGTATSLSSSQDYIKQIVVKYSYRTTVRSRRYAGNTSYQMLPRSVRSAVAPQIIMDLDMQAAQWNIMLQIMQKLDVQLDVEAAKFPFLQKYTSDPSGVIESWESSLGGDAKSILLSIMNGAGVPNNVKEDPELISLYKESRIMIWVACHVFASGLEAAVSEKREWPESTAFHYLYSAVEDFVLSAAVEYVKRWSPRHLSLHYDGLMLETRFSCNREKFLNDLNNHVKETTGFCLNFREKHQHDWVHLLKDTSTQENLSQNDHMRILTRNGNCVAVSLAHMIQEYQVLAEMCEEPSDANRNAQRLKYRRYLDVLDAYNARCQPSKKRFLAPHLGLVLVPGQVSLLHVTAAGVPHCLGLRVEEDEKATVFDGFLQYTTTVQNLRICLKKCLPDGLMVTYVICSDQPEPLSDSRAVLMELRAGASPARSFIESLADQQGAPTVSRNTASSSSSTGNGAPAHRRRIFGKTTPLRFSVRAHTHGQVLGQVELPQAASQSSGLDDMQGLDAEANCVEEETLTVLPCRALLDCLAAEIEFLKKKILENKLTHCPVCPWRAFGRQRHLVTHFQRYHTEKAYFYCANSKKQFKLVTALWDHACLQQGRTNNLLQRSAEILRSSVQPPLSKTTAGQNADRCLRLVLDIPAPRFVNCQALPKDLAVRRIGVYYYTQAFAEVIFRQALDCGASFCETHSRVAHTVTASGTELCSLLPSWIITWEKIMDDIFNSEIVRSMQRDLIQQCYLWNEFATLSIDCTFRLMMALLGQVSYRAPGSVRNEQAIPAGDMLHALCTVRGKFGSVLAMEPISGESAGSMATMLLKVFKHQYLQQVQVVVVDDPSKAMLVKFQEICPCLRGLALDPMHLAFVYEATQWRKRTPGSRFLRAILRAVCGRHAVYNADGVFYEGEAVAEDRVLSDARALILSGELPQRIAQRLLDVVDTAVIDGPVDYITHLSALSALFPDEAGF